MTTYQATRTECEQFDRAVVRLADLTARVCEARGELVLAGVGTFDTEKEHRFLMRLEARLSKMHLKLASRARRVRQPSR